MKIYRDRGYIHLDQDDPTTEVSLNAQKASLLIDVINDSFTSGVQRIVRYGVRPDGQWAGQFTDDEGETYGFLINPQSMSVQTGLISGG